MKQKKLLVIDGQGGKMGRAVVEQLKSRFPGQELIALGMEPRVPSPEAQKK